MIRHARPAEVIHCIISQTALLSNTKLQDIRSAHANGPFAPDNGVCRLRQRATCSGTRMSYSARPQANRADCLGRCLVCTPTG